MPDASAVARTVVVGTGPFWAWVSVVGLTLAVLFFLAMAVITVGASFVKRAGAPPHTWIAGVVALAGAAWFVQLASERFTEVSRIEIDARGGWTLVSPAGRRLAGVPPEAERRLCLWVAGSSSSSTSRRRDALHGRVEAGGQRYRLEVSSSFWLLRDLGYGDVVVRHRDLTNPGGAARLDVGRGDGEPTCLPAHAYDAEGLARVRDWLDGKAWGGKP